MSRARVLILLLLSGCHRAPETTARDLAVDRGVDLLRVILEAAAAERGRDLLAERDLGPPPCPTSPCAARPIIFLHGFAGSNEDYFTMLTGLLASDARYDSFLLAGLLDHTGWSARSIPRRSWLFSFDYYINHKEDGRGSYTGGPGRIGSNTSHACSAPPGSGHLVADKLGYDSGSGHDYSADLAGFVESVLRATGATEVDLVVHSMGGLIARSYLSFLGGAAKVKRCLLIASPVRGVPLAGFLTRFPFGYPAWMSDHEAAELDGGSAISKIHFSRCGETGGTPGAWAVKLLDHELLNHPSTELYVMSGALDPSISHEMADHPLAVSHEVVSGADHTGTLKKTQTLERVRQLLGGQHQ